MARQPRLNIAEGVEQRDIVVDDEDRLSCRMVAGGGIKGGHSHGQTDEFGYNAAVDIVHDLHATNLNQLGVDHKRLFYKSQGHEFRLTDVSGSVIEKTLA